MSADEAAREVLANATCALCPNPIGDAPARSIVDPQHADMIDKLAEVGPGSVVQGADGSRMMFVHVSCYVAAKLVVKVLGL